VLFIPAGGGPRGRVEDHWGEHEDLGGGGREGISPGGEVPGTAFSHFIGGRDFFSPADWLFWVFLSASFFLDNIKLFVFVVNKQ
jgi:hypothetical protein